MYGIFLKIILLSIISTYYFHCLLLILFFENELYVLRTSSYQTSMFMKKKSIYFHIFNNFKLQKKRSNDQNTKKQKVDI